LVEFSQYYYYIYYNAVKQFKTSFTEFLGLDWVIENEIYKQGCG